MNYKIITNEERFRSFIEWLPDLKHNETFYVCLFGRKKYSPVIRLKSDKTQLKRFTANNKNLFWKVKQLECELGSYRQEETPIPQEALVVYINPNPRCFIKATSIALKKFADRVTQPYNGHNPHQDVMSAIQQSCGRKLWIDFDFDGVAPHDLFYHASQSLNAEAFSILRTRGGCHLLVRLDKIHTALTRTWYKDIINLPYEVDVRGDIMLPIPGCTQGGFEPYFEY